MAVIKTKIDKTTTVNEAGEEVSVTKESTIKVEKCSEPDFIKIYTNMWCEFNDIPSAYRDLFFQLAIRMSYANPVDLNGGQIVYTFSPTCDEIMKSLGWKKAMFHRGIKTLVDIGAIRKINRGVYQVNPNYAGKGEWKYNPRLERGGIEDLVARFNFKDKTVETQIIWAEDGKDNAFNRAYREGLATTPEENTVLKRQKIFVVPQEPQNATEAAEEPSEYKRALEV